MQDKVTVTILVEERVSQSGLIAEHGFAVWLETSTRRILFDTGQHTEIAPNAHTLGVKLQTCDTIALSHGHYDHSGGLATVLPLTKVQKVYAHQVALDQKFAKNDDGTSRNNGMPQGSRQLFQRNPGLLSETKAPTDLGSGFWLTGEIPRKTDYEDSGGEYFKDPHCLNPDPIQDDQALFFNSTKGLVVILGCAHAGVINTVNYICELSGNKKVHAVVGGMHLIHASKERVQSTMEALESIGPDFLGLSHCTGSSASKRLKSAFKNKCLECQAGTKFSFEST